MSKSILLNGRVKRSSSRKDKRVTFGSGSVSVSTVSGSGRTSSVSSVRSSSSSSNSNNNNNSNSKREEYVLEEIFEIPAANNKMIKQERRPSETLSSKFEMYRYQRRLCCENLKDPTKWSYVTRHPINICKGWKKLQNKWVQVFENEWKMDLALCSTIKQISLLQPMTERVEPNADLFSAWHYWTLLMSCERMKDKRIQELRLRNRAQGKDDDDDDDDDDEDEDDDDDYDDDYYYYYGNSNKKKKKKKKNNNNNNNNNEKKMQEEKKEKEKEDKTKVFKKPMRLKEILQEKEKEAEELKINKSLEMQLQQVLERLMKCKEDLLLEKKQISSTITKIKH